MRRLRAESASVCAFVLLFVVVLLPVQAAGQDDGKAVVKIMTYNVNEGTDFLEVLSATNLPDFLNAVQVTLNHIDSTNPPMRMRAVAKEIVKTQPDLVGLQEVTTWSVGGKVKYDMLQELISALHDFGEDYFPVVIVDEFQLAAPLPDLVTVVQGVNHDVILARAASEMELSNPQQGHFTVILPVPIPVPPGVLPIPRGWGSIDVNLHGQSLRFVVSHLENFVAQSPGTLLIQEAQASELALGPAGTTLPVVIAVDANADALGGDPTIATYQLVRGFGFGEAWADGVHRPIALLGLDTRRRRAAPHLRDVGLAKCSKPTVSSNSNRAAWLIS